MTIARRSFIAAGILLGLGIQADAADKASVGVLRFVSSGGLYLGLERGYFAAEGIELDLKFFEAAQAIAVAVASGDAQFGLTGITGGSLNLAGKGGVKIIASQGAEKKGVPGNTLVVSNEAFAKGINSFEKLDGASVAISQVGSTFHYQLGQVAAAKGFALDKITMRPLQSIPNMVAAVKTNQVDAAILPPHIAGPMAERGEVKKIGPLSDIADYQYGALFAQPKVLTDNRSLAERFVRAYQKGLKDYDAALMRFDAKGQRIADDLAKKAGEQIGKYVYPSDQPDVAAKKVIDSAPYCDPSGKIDMANVEKQIAWYKSEKLVDATVEAKNFVDTSFAK
jgi:NitT/TauT family transport system substrate-binding protein